MTSVPCGEMRRCTSVASQRDSTLKPFTPGQIISSRTPTYALSWVFVIRSCVVVFSISSNLGKTRTLPGCESLKTGLGGTCCAVAGPCSPMPNTAIFAISRVVFSRSFIYTFLFSFYHAGCLPATGKVLVLLCLTLEIGSGPPPFSWCLAPTCLSAATQQQRACLVATKKASLLSLPTQ